MFIGGVFKSYTGKLLTIEKAFKRQNQAKVIRSCTEGY